MRYLAVGDIHGCFDALIAVVASARLLPDDVLITLGDYVNRGPDTRAVLDWLIEFQARGNLVPLRGNHEIMMLQARESVESRAYWLECGGDATLASYATGAAIADLTCIPDAHWDFLELETRAWYETETHFFVHANALPDYPLVDQPDFVLYWESFSDPPPHESGKIMVCGHTSQKSGVPLSIGHAICIDTWACGRGWLTCLDVNSGRYWQANQSGQTRDGWLEA
jgi:serine/threonine protein phosphatase 1